MAIISQKLACDIWKAHAEIAKVESMKEEIATAQKWHKEWTPEDRFGEHSMFQLGVRSGATSHTLCNVSNELVPYMIEAHLANKKRELEELCVKAKMELNGVLDKPAPDDQADADEAKRIGMEF